MSLSGPEVGLWKAFGSVGPLQPQPTQVPAAAACPASAAVQIFSPPASAAAFEAVPGWCFDRTVIVLV